MSCHLLQPVPLCTPCWAPTRRDMVAFGSRLLPNPWRSGCGDYTDAPGWRRGQQALCALSPIKWFHFVCATWPLQGTHALLSVSLQALLSLRCPATPTSSLSPCVRC